jgi:hypothetical protein
MLAHVGIRHIVKQKEGTLDTSEFTERLIQGTPAAVDTELLQEQKLGVYSMDGST